MSLRDADSFDHYKTADITFSNVDKATFGGSPAIIDTDSHDGPQCLLLSGNATVTVSLGFGAYTNAGAWWKFPELPAVDTLILSSVDTAVQQFGVWLDSAGHLFCADSSGVTQATSTQTITPGQWTMIDLHAVFNPTTGAIGVTVYRGGGAEVFLNATACNTDSLGSGGGVNVIFGSAASAIDILLDSVYVNDDLGGDNTDPNGSDTYGISYFGAESPTTHNGFTPNTGTNLSCINQAFPDGDTTFNLNAEGSLASDLFFMQQIPASGPTPFVQAVVCARSPLPTSCAAIYGSGFDFSPNGTSSSPDPTYGFVTAKLGIDSFTGLPFTFEGINAYEWGYGVVFETEHTEMAVTQFGIEVMIAGSAPAPVAMNYIWSS